MKEIDRIVNDIDVKVRQSMSDNISLRKQIDERDVVISTLQSRISDLIEKNKQIDIVENKNKLNNIISNNSDIFFDKLMIDAFLEKINKSIEIISKNTEEK